VISIMIKDGLIIQIYVCIHVNHFHTHKYILQKVMGNGALNVLWRLIDFHHSSFRTIWKVGDEQNWNTCVNYFKNMNGQNHRMAWAERDLRDHTAPNPCLWHMAAIHHIRPPRASLWLWLWVPPGGLCQCLTILSVKNLPMTFNLNLSSFILKPFPLVHQ